MVESRELPKGTMVHIGGIPFCLSEPAKLETHPNNWEIAFEDFGKDNAHEDRPQSSDGS